MQDPQDTSENASENTSEDTSEDTPQFGSKPPAKRKGPGRPKATRRGRPPKAEIAKKTPGNRGKVGRPKGDAAIINDFKARMLNSPKSKKVIEAIFDAALTDGHPNQSAAWKLVIDRIAPVSSFEADIKRSGGKSGVTINIQGLGEKVAISGKDEEIIEGDFTED